MDKLSFKIRGMDCAEEVAILKREIGPLVGGADCLAFDILKGKMDVSPTKDTADESFIEKAVRKTGMTAIPWASYEKNRSAETFWTERGRLIMCLASGGLLILGFLVHWNIHGSFLDALTGKTEGEHSFPLISIFFYLAAVASGAWFVAPKAYYSARKLRPDINLLMMIAGLGAILIGEWFEAAAVVFLFSFANVLESWSVGRARGAIRSLLDVAPETAHTICPHDGCIEEKPIADIPPGVTVLVRPGEKIPLDGKIIKGETSVNQAPITGESLPVAKTIGDEVYAGTINGDGAVEFLMTKAADDTTLARMIRMVEEAHTKRAKSEQWVEIFARYYTPSMIVFSFLVAVVPPLFFGGLWGVWFYEALVILVIACPCALVISTPVSIVAGLTTAARGGVLIKGGIFLEAIGQIKAIGMDKTGTITYGTPKVQKIYPLHGHTEEELLIRAAALETHSQHPLARGILEKAKESGVAYSPADNYTTLTGKGAFGTFEGRTFWIGSHRLTEELQKETPEVHGLLVELEESGNSIVAVCNDAHVCGIFSISDSVRPAAKKAIEEMKELGVQSVVMLTGDNERTAAKIADQSGVNEYHANLLPGEKVKAVGELTRRFGKVAMIGDGVNDAPAIAAATIGIAMGAMGTDAAIETADIALMSDELRKIPWLIRHSRRTLKVIKQNIFFALGLKALFLILALASLATLWMAIAADMGASLLVIFNGLRLLKD